MNETTEEAGSDTLEQTPQEIEAVLMAVWRRVLQEGCGPEMSITEAAAVLGASVGSVRRRVAAGIIPAYRDAKGRLRIVPRIVPSAVESAASEMPSMAGRLMEELKNTQQQLNEALRERAGLIKEKAAAEQALQHTKEELAAMWRLLSARTSGDPRPTQTGRERIERLEDLPRAGANVSKIQYQVTTVRQLVKRRKWPWALVG